MKTRKLTRILGGTQTTDQSYCLCQVYPLQTDRPGTIVGYPIKNELMIGRGIDSSEGLRIDDSSVSRTHFQLTVVNNELLLDDLDSSNGTHVNGARIDSCRLRVQDVVRAGETLFVVTRKEPEDLSWARTLGLVAASSKMGEILRKLRRVSRSTASILLVGETGTGKDVLAKLIHAMSKRPGDLHKLNCATLPATLIETTLFGAVKGAYTGALEDQPGIILQSDKSTLLLDEIGEIPCNLQAKLLRVLEDRVLIPVGSSQEIRVDVRFIAATNRLDSLSSGSASLRADLLARIEDVVMVVPPLRERREDIPLIVDWAAASVGTLARARITSDFVESALIHPWPRNVRQLIKAVKGALTQNHGAEPLGSNDLQLPDEEHNQPQNNGSGEQGGADSREAVHREKRPPPPFEDFQRAYLETDGNISAMARILCCDRRQVYRWLRRFGFHPGTSDEELV